ncbi:YcfA-like protein [Candidatus Magnetomoraceae bacterium gMMP-15]
MPQKIKELIKKLKESGFYGITSGGKGSHRKYTHSRYPGAVTLSGKSGNDAKNYQIKQVKQAIEMVKK